MLEEYLLLCIVAAVAGGINAIAGGATLLTFPVLYAALGRREDAAVVANATNTVALVPAAIAALGAYRREFAVVSRWAWWLFWPSLAGGVIGSLLVVLLPPKAFEVAVPWLILAAATMFALQPQLARWVRVGQAQEPPTGRVAAAALLFQFGVAVYGGYFGAGIGIMMLAALAMIGLSDIHQMNAIKALLGSVINGVSVVVFAVSGNVHWPYAVAMSISAAIGGYFGANIARRVNRMVVRGFVVLLGFGLAGYYFYREFGQ